MQAAVAAAVDFEAAKEVVYIRSTTASAAYHLRVGLLHSQPAIFQSFSACQRSLALHYNLSTCRIGPPCRVLSADTSFIR